MTRKEIYAPLASFDVNEQHAIRFRDAAPAVLQCSGFGASDLLFDLRHRYNIVEDFGERASTFRATTLGYEYRILDRRGAELICFHWDDQSGQGRRRFPHVHVTAKMTIAGFDDLPIVRPADRLHIPTRRMSIESVIRLLIEDFRVVPLRPDWDRLLLKSEAGFRRCLTRDP